MEDSSKNSFIKEWGLTIISAVVIGLLLWKFLIYTVWITSGSMIPTLEVKDRLVATRVHNPENLNRGDIVIFDSDELKEILIKRLIGLPGDHIEIKNGIVSVNGEQLVEDYVKNNEDYDRIFDVPQGEYFFLGDNRANSDDSRYWKNPYIKSEKIQGKAKVKIYPISDFKVYK
ncbi:signal peptidase I [Clostridium botulinum]|uniref:Signal peptidase I n=1 Tax=Clostridium botulinum (strain Eklund 17B / Type B) TaxID=935198 RepID=B2TQL4_CLOBB|nr:signal peptidase I [Clostridium sp. ZBS12]ACD23472.1 signal peptidase I [Clostridium botulinum B str. Eklund 17B (NRP)]MBY6975649.1 signal peptidase I [Clostridium botulinum]MBY7001198.1 signal peptidase I [Clostridium botulinum]MCR1273965.1 signal peptidase I [Clostridium botulinum]NFD69271.1 signal peptidase I [Clostridium botulinum]